MRGSGSRRRRRGKVGRRGFRSGRTYLHATSVSAGTPTDQGEDTERGNAPRLTGAFLFLPLAAPPAPRFPPVGVAEPESAAGRFPCGLSWSAVVEKLAVRERRGAVASRGGRATGGGSMMCRRGRTASDWLKSKARGEGGSAELVGAERGREEAAAPSSSTNPRRPDRAPCPSC